MPTPFSYNFVGVSGFSGAVGLPGTSLLTATQSNTFSAGQAIYRAAGSYVLAQANAVSSSDVTGIIQNVTSTALTAVVNGNISGLTGLVDGNEYWLSDTTAGALVSAQPTATGSVIKPLLIATGTSTGVVVTYPGALIGSTNFGVSGYYGKWTGAQNLGTGLITDNGTTVNVTASTASTSTTTGALTVAGGLGVGGALNVGGNVAIGTTPSAWSGFSALDIGGGGSIAGSSLETIILQNAYFNGSNLIYKNTGYATFYDLNNGQFIWKYAPSGTAGTAITFTEAMRINGNGNVGIGTASPAYTLDLSGSARIVTSLGVGTTPSGTTGEIRATGNITAYYSDDRLKTKLGVIENALDKICSLEGFYYEANETAQALGYEPVREVGISAQATQKVLPEIVAPAPIDEKYLTIRYERLAPLLIEAIKELREENKLLREEIKALK